MTDTETATEPTTTSAADTVPAGLYSEHINLMVDVETRAYFLGQAIIEAKAKGYRDPREAATIREAFDAVLKRARRTPGYAEAVDAGRAELAHRARARAARRLARGTDIRDAIARGRLATGPQQ